MDRIDTVSIHDDRETRTMYKMVEAWTEQPWDGKQYKCIAEGLWDSIEELNLMEGPYGAYGMSVTLLESCIVDSSEGIDVGLFQVEQAIDNLKKLLENNDFAVGARIIEVSVNTNPVCRISNADQLLDKSQSIDYRKPQWWTRSVRSYWLLIGVVPFCAMLIVYIIIANLGFVGPERIFAYLVITLPAIASAYYIRTIPSRRLWRGIAIGMGSCFIGLWFIFVPLVLLFSSIFGVVPFWFGWPVGLIVSMVLGGFIGDWIGKRNDYMPYM